jgi:SAM-dependent methyltransferase
LGIKNKVNLHSVNKNYKIKKQYLNRLNTKAILESIKKNPSILKFILLGKNRQEIRSKIKELELKKSKILAKNEIKVFVSNMKTNSIGYDEINPKNEIKLNKLCSIEDWKNVEVNEIISKLQEVSETEYVSKAQWEMTNTILKSRKKGFIHRKDWEWAIGVIAMKRFGKLNKDSKAVGIGAGREEILFYLANKLSHVYATDIYDGQRWKNFAPTDFLKNPKKYAPFPYKEDALTVLKMDGTNLDFPDNTFDIAFSFSSIEHFGGENHSGALKSMKEIERVLKPGGIAVIATEYILNDKDHPEFFNQRTIYSDLIDKLDKLKLVEPLDLRITTNTLENIIDHFNIDANWDKMSNEYKRNHPLILLKIRNILFTSVMLIFQKQPAQK